jgi:hypothetical protein
MKSFLIKIALFFIPLGLYLLAVLIIDPYNYSSISNVIDDEIKSEVSYKIHYPLWKLNNFKRNPIPNILLGDSRVNSISIDYVNKTTNELNSNLGYGGSSLREIIDTFWETTKYVKLKKVYIGINFNLYNAYNKKNRVLEAISLGNNFFSNALNRYTFKSTLIILKSTLFNIPVDFDKPDMTKDEFWEYQETVFIKGFYEFYEYPKEYYKELNEIATYCEKENIQLTFFIPPTHINLQNKVVEFKLESEQEKFISDLNSIGKVYNFDYPSEITKNRNNFKDPFHLNDSILNETFNEVISKEKLK